MKTRNEAVDRIVSIMRGCVDAALYDDEREALTKHLMKNDVVEVVRCEKCKHYLKDTEFCRRYNEGYCEYDNTIKPAEHYCGYGLRKGTNNA